MAGDRSARPTLPMLGLLAPLALLVTVALGWSDVGRPEFARAVGGILNYGYGTPMDWLMQPAPYDLDELLFRDPRAVHTTVLWVPFVVDVVLVYLLLLGVLLIVRLVIWNVGERVGNRAWESQRPEAERFGHAVDEQIGRLLSPEGWHLNLGACTAGPDGFAVLYEHDAVQHEIWFEYNPRSGVAEPSIPGWNVAMAATHGEDEAIAFFAREVKAAIDAPDGLRHLDDEA